MSITVFRSVEMRVFRGNEIGPRASIMRFWKIVNHHWEAKASQNEYAAVITTVAESPGSY